MKPMKRILCGLLALTLTLSLLLVGTVTVAYAAKTAEQEAAEQEKAAQMAALEQQIGECEAAMSGCGSDYVKLQELMAKQTALEAALEEKTERWVYLMELKEKIDAQT